MNQTLQRESPQQVMHGSLPEMLHCLNLTESLAGNMDLTVFERQRARLKWQEQQSQQCCFDNPALSQTQLPSFVPNVAPASGLPEGSVLQEMLNQTVSRVKNDPRLVNGWSDFGTPSFLYARKKPDSDNLGFAISRTSSCPADFPAEVAEKVIDSSFSQKIPIPTSPVLPKESPKKRKSERAHQRNDVPSSAPKIMAAEEMKEKRIKADTEARKGEVDSKGTDQNNNNNNQRESSGDTAKDNSKISEVQKPDFIHVRARRGQATDSHSLAERVRREKISERMKYLQDLVPGCNKITGKAGMLDEIINYVQSLQRQVEFLSMKLASVNPRIDFNIDHFFSKEMFPACNSSFPAIGLSPELANTSFLQFNPVNPAGSMLCGVDIPVNSPEIAALRRTTSAPVSAPDQFIDSCFPANGSSSTWDHEIQNLYNMEFNQGRASSFQTPTFPGGNLEINNLKMEM